MEAAAIQGQLEVAQQVSNAVLVAPFVQACGGLFSDCITALDSYEALYASLAPEYQPAAYKFWDSDYAFARERITSSPKFLRRVDGLSQIPFIQDDVVGYDDITGGTSLSQLVDEKRVRHEMI